MKYRFNWAQVKIYQTLKLQEDVKCSWKEHNFLSHYISDKHLGVSIPGVPATPEDSVH